MLDGRKSLFSGMQATGNLTLGNYLGALKNWVALCNEYECYYSVVDMHSITVRQDPSTLRKRARSLLTLFIAAGIDPKKCCVCNHARMVMYISAEGRALPCMSLSGMDIQERFPLIPEMGLSKCITDSFYMDFINTRADKVLEHNPECADCPWRSWCLGGCRASGLDGSGQTDLMYKDPACCMMFRDGWIGRLTALMKQIKPEASGPVTRDEMLIKALEQQPKL